MEATARPRSEPIAIIGIACWYPDAPNPLRLWENVLARRRQFRRLPARRLPLDDYHDPDPKTADTTYGQRAAVIDGFEFDWAGRRIPFSTYRSTDVAHWLALETALSAVADAGYRQQDLPAEKTGVIVGNTLTGEQTRTTSLRLRWPYVRRVVREAAAGQQLSPAQSDRLIGEMEQRYKAGFSPINEDTLAGGLSNTIAGRICNYLNLYGGGYTVDGACASSLLAVATAGERLAQGELDLALAGGVDISLDPFELVGFAKAGALTPTEMRVYDRRGNGFIPGEGCGFVLLKRMADARRDGDYVYALLHGWGISSDGGHAGITAPSAKGQARALQRAYAKAPYGVADLDFIEGHGTGTAVGDRIELEGIALAMNGETDGEASRTGVTSLKSLIGHTKAASGVGGLIKAVMAVNRRVLPPTAGCAEPHPVFEEKARRLYPLIQGETRAADSYLRAGVSAMGFGGINCHLTISSAHPPAPALAPALSEETLLASAQESELFAFSATSPRDLDRQIDQLAKLAEEISMAEMTDLAAEMASRTDAAAPMRAALVAGTPDELVAAGARLAQLARQETSAGTALARHDRRRSVWLGGRRQSLRVGFLFPGQGAQRIDMGRRLVARHPWARELFEMGVARVVAAGGTDLSELLHPRVSTAAQEGHHILARTENAQPAICLISMLYLEYLSRLGISPTAVGGHSLGELSAFCAAGAYDRHTLLDLATLRGQAMAEAHGEGGGMVSLQCSYAGAERLLEQIDDYLILANHNSPRQMVLSGESRAVEQAIQLAAADGILTHRLAVSGAFHSRLGASAARRIGKEARLPDTIDHLRCQLFTSTDGSELNAGAALQQHFVDQIQSQVDFVAMVAQMGRTCDQFVEVGPGRALSGLVADINSEAGPVCLPVEPAPDGDAALNTTLASLYAGGLDIRWEVLFNRRLTRPFVTPDKRIFIDNPCETARDPSALALTVARPEIQGDGDGRVARLTGMSGTELQAYIDRRGLFLADIIQADRKYMSPWNGEGGAAAGSGSDGGGKGPRRGAEPREEDTAVAEDEAAVEDPLAALKALAAEITGFPLASITAEARLLDDLNLDSIKAGDLLMRFAGQMNISWPGDPRLMANAALEEVAAAAARLLEGTQPPKTAPAPRTQAPEPQPLPRTSMAAQLLNIVEQLTGFPRQSLSLEQRLLDDLNLDSIKAGDLVSRAMRQMSISADVDLRSMANATLQEILDVLTRHRSSRPTPSGGPPGDGAAGALEELTRTAAEITGFPSANLQPDLMVESDLRIGPEMLTAILRQTTARLGIQNRVDIGPLRERSLAQIAAILDRMQQRQGPSEAERLSAAIQQIDDGAHDWVRDFGVILAPEPLPALPAGWGQRREDDWEEAHVRIYYDASAQELAAALRSTLFDAGAWVELEAFDPEQPVSRPTPEISHLVLILPMTTEDRLQEDRLAEMIRRLSSVCAPPPAASAPRKRSTVVFIQFGGGDFGADPRFAVAERCSSQALAASLHHERGDLRVRCLDFSPALTAEQMAAHTVAELKADSDYAAVGYDFRQRRGRPRPTLLAPAAYLPRGIDWGPEDVIVVSGGAKGITAACALAVARETQVRMALLGRSSHPDATPDDPSSAAVRQTLERFTAAGLTAEYYCCDVANHDSVTATLTLIREEMGPITGLIHGAGLNRPRPLEQVDPEAAYAETAPKLNGARHLLAALADSPPKLIMAMTSIIGITGMPGNGWYGFSNEALALDLLAFGAAHPATQTQSVAYSIWRDEGMGARMGSVTHLQNQGIWAIPTEEGTRRFVTLFLNTPGHHQVAVAARLGGLDTWRWPEQAGPPKARFLEERLIHTPGVESLCSARLSLETDPYLKDHRFQGSFLFPTVCGLEAMAEAAAHALGTRALRQVRFEEVRLERPITVDPQRGAEILIRAEVLEAATAAAPAVVQAAVYKAHAGIRAPFFSARLVVPRASEPPKQALDTPAKATPLDPASDLYRPSLLFQGERFQRIRKVWRIAAAGDDEGAALFEAEQRPAELASGDAFGEADRYELVLGDLFFRDALLQSAALLVPQDRSLPVFIRRWEINHLSPTDAVARLAEVRLLERTADELTNSVVALDEGGRVLERLEGYRLKILQHLPDYPTVADLLDPTRRDATMIRQRLASIAGQAALEVPRLGLAYIEGIHTLGKAERHRVERPLLMATAREALEAQSTDPQGPLEIVWSEAGRPEVASLPLETVGLSLTHDDRLCLCVAAPGPQGCDLTAVIPRSRDRWHDLIGPDQSPLLETLMGADEPLDLAAARIWAAQEALLKACGRLDARLSGPLREDDLVFFGSADLEEQQVILTLPLRLTWGPRTVLALVVRRRPSLDPPQVPAADAALAAATQEASMPYAAGYSGLREMAAFDIIPVGPQGQPVFVYRFPISFRPGANPGGGILFSHYFSWMGIMREASAWPIKDAVAAQIKSGRFGSVTNYSHLTVLGEGTANDLIEGRVWASANAGPEDSSMTFSYDFLKMLPDGGYERVAFSRLETTWVEIVGQGEARTAPYPPYYAEFVADMLPRYEAPDVPEAQPEPLRPLLEADPGAVLYQAPEGPEPPPPVYALEMTTGWQHANLVGNIYYANYYEWQGLTRDRCFYELDPRPVIPGQLGKSALCLECRIDHLREAMPFDRILVQMGISRMDATGGMLHFTYHRKDEGGGLTKLASGWQRVIWVVRDTRGRPAPTGWPAAVRAGLLARLPGN